MNKASEPRLASARKSRHVGKTRKITYLYRDAGNYKFWGEFCVLGELSLDNLRPHLFGSEYFVPEKIGIPSLVPESQNDDDHLLHEFHSIEPTEPALCPFTADELIERLRTANASGWFSEMF
ncbi:MAG TPA: hypothetical protein VNX86_17600 [Rhizomicrobium sp.]|jgi:hypothetical protein|nr:hypothetical protein [Rhizomicrobium sp.]